MITQLKHEYFMNEALRYAEKALSDGEFPVGCVFVYDEQIISAGARESTVISYTNEIDHAEIIAIRKLNLADPLVHYSGITAYCTLEPCLMCFGALLINGISQIVYAYEDAMGGGTNCDLKSLPSLYGDYDITIIPNVLRRRSLNLFKTFFNNPNNKYLTNSFLAEYTRAQR